MENPTEIDKFWCFVLLVIAAIVVAIRFIIKTIQIRNRLKLDSQKIEAKRAKLLHSFIQLGNSKEVKSIIDEFPTDKRFYDCKKVSAAAAALKCEQLQIYSLLVTRGVTLGFHENFSELVNHFDCNAQEELKNIHKKLHNEQEEILKRYIKKKIY